MTLSAETALVTVGTSIAITLALMMGKGLMQDMVCDKLPNSAAYEACQKDNSKGTK
jgi:hypothetical protein